MHESLEKMFGPFLDALVADQKLSAMFKLTLETKPLCSAREPRTRLGRDAVAARHEVLELECRLRAFGERVHDAAGQQPNLDSSLTALLEAALLTRLNRGLLSQAGNHLVAAALVNILQERGSFEGQDALRLDLFVMDVASRTADRRM